MTPRLSAIYGLLIGILLFNSAFADECPGPDASLPVVKNAIDAFQRNDRAPSGADCAYKWAINYPADSLSLDAETLNFFSAASDVQRVAATQRQTEQRQADSDKYFDQEIALRQKFLKLALNDTANETPQVHRAVIQNISYLVSALASRRQYAEVADDLGEEDPAVIDNAALSVWLQAVWSCAQWDGNKKDLCPDRQKCQEKVGVFLDSVDQIKNRPPFPPQTRRDLADLKALATTGCLK